MPRRHAEGRLSRARVCFVLPSLNGGGAERAAVTVMNALDRDRFEPELCLFRREGAYLDQVARDVRVREIGDGASRFGRVSALRRMFEATRPHVVMSFLSYVSVFVAARWARGGIRFVINQQTPVTAFLEDGDFRWHQPGRRAVFERGVRLVYPRADSIVATSQGVRDDLVTTFGVRRDRVTVLHNPVDLARTAMLAREPIERAAAEPGERIIAAAGRLADVKNFPLLIAAVGLLAERMRVRLWILGHGEEEAALRGLVAELGLTDRVTFLGFQSNPWRYIARADVFTLTSRYEGFGNVLIEAMACGVPVVATSSSGTREIIEHGVNGVLVDAHTPAAVARALQQVLEDRTAAERLVAQARARMADYDVPVVTGRYQALFESLMHAA
jgi:glycosyltransferase involved in cell wall biosynthesis